MLFTLAIHRSSSDAVDGARPAELSDVFRDHADFVWRGLRRLGVSEADADDALQEVFLVVARRLPEYRERGALRAWLFCIARQVALHVRRGHSRRVRRETERARLQELSAADPYRALEQKQTADLVQRALDSLDEGQAMVVYLADVEELSAPEIAAALSLPLTTIYGRLRIGRARFETLLRQYQLRAGDGP